jgi:pilus assembly protein Flp/PilA
VRPAPDPALVPSVTGNRRGRLTPPVEPTYRAHAVTDVADSSGKEVNTTMTLFNALISLLDRDEEGQGLAEYALILALIAIVAIIALIFLGNQVSQILSTVGNSI